MVNKTDNYEFKAKVVRNVYDSDTFKVYAVDADLDKYPFLKKNKYGNIGISGDIPALAQGIEYKIVATEESGRYGASYHVLNIVRNTPLTEHDTMAFLEEILTENQARTLYENYPDVVDRIMNDKADTIDITKLYGIGEKTFEKIKQKIIENFKLAELIGEFKGLLTLNMLKRIYNKYESVEALKKKLKTQPYTTLTGISGVGFKTADAIVSQLQEEGIIDFGFDIKTSMDRCLSCILYLLEENENNGHTKANLIELRKQCKQLVPACADYFVEAVKDESIYYDKDTLGIALRNTYETERYIAKTILENIGKCDRWEFDIEKYRTIGEFKLSDEQMNAVKNLCISKISILNGGAGSGKSFSTQAVINMLEENNKRFMLFAPTGKASKVIQEYTKRDASTIHRGLGYVPGEGWSYNARNKLETDVVIVDEMSMCDARLFSHLIEAIDFEHTRLLMIGDNAQLPSVSCGNLLHDFMESNIIPLTTLTKVFRYSEGGLMTVATDTRFCKPFLNNGMRSRATTFGNNGDYTFIDIPQEQTVKTIASLYKKLLNKGVGVSDIQVLTSKNVGDYGTIALNSVLQKIANPNYGSDNCMKYGDVCYYKGDMVMQVVNNYKAEVYGAGCVPNVNGFTKPGEDDETAFVANGENGVVKRVTQEYLVIDFGGIPVKYGKDSLGMIRHSYACTIHKSQGASIENVILCTPKSHTFMLNSNLIYTGLTRMKDRCYHIGSVDTVNLAVKKKANIERHTFMQQLLLNSENK